VETGERGSIAVWISAQPCMCRAFGAPCGGGKNPALTRGSIIVSPLRGWSGSHSRALSFNRVSQEQRREAPAGNSRARERVVTDEK